MKQELVSIIAAKIDTDKEVDAAAQAQQHMRARERDAQSEVREAEHMLRVADRLVKLAVDLEEESLALLSTRVVFEPRKQCQ